MFKEEQKLQNFYRAFLCQKYDWKIGANTSEKVCNNNEMQSIPFKGVWMHYNTIERKKNEDIANAILKWEFHLQLFLKRNEKKNTKIIISIISPRIWLHRQISRGVKVWKKTHNLIYINIICDITLVVSMECTYTANIFLINDLRKISL